MIELKQITKLIAEKGLPDKIYITSESDSKILHSVKRLVTIEKVINLQKFPNGAFIYGREKIEFEQKRKRKIDAEE